MPVSHTLDLAAAVQAWRDLARRVVAITDISADLAFVSPNDDDAHHRLLRLIDELANAAHNALERASLMDLATRAGELVSAMSLDLPVPSEREVVWRFATGDIESGTACDVAGCSYEQLLDACRFHGWPTWIGKTDILDIRRYGEPMLVSIEDDTDKPTGQRPSRDLVNSRVALATVAVQRALGRKGMRVLKGSRAFAMIIRVPTAQWVEPVEQAIGLLGHKSLVIECAEKQSSRAKEATRISLAMSRGHSVVAITDNDPDKQLPELVLATRTHEFEVQMVGVDTLALSMKLCLIGRLPATHASLDLSRLDFDALTACMPIGQTKAEAVRRLRVAIDRTVSGPTFGPQSGSLRLPTLDKAIEYGAARMWGLDLAADFDDLRAGKINFSDIDRGAVWEGPPGSGKSTLAAIVAQACKVPLVASSVAELFATSSGYLDGVIKAQRKVFAEAMAAAPCILFLDELNALPNPETISNRGRDWWMPVILDFFLLLDSAMSSRDGVVVIGATNRIEDIAPALLRPGRLERAIHIGAPVAEGLLNILRTHLGEDLAGEDLLPLARTGASSGATAAIAMDWVRSARRVSRREGGRLSLEHLKAQIVPPDDRPYEDRYRIAVHEAGHAVAGLIMEQALVSVSILRGARSEGQTTFEPLRTVMMDKRQIERMSVVLLAGHAAEEEILSASAGWGGSQDSDLALATRTLAAMHASFGLGEGFVWQGPPDEAEFLLRRNPKLQEVVETDLKRLYGCAVELVRSHRRSITEVADRLLAQGSLMREQLGDIPLGTV
jgi:cell division protease FtsH